MGYILDRKVEGESEKWVNWQSQLTIFTCYYCYEKHGTIFSPETPYDPVPVHVNCQCELVPMRTVQAGQATDMGL